MSNIDFVRGYLEAEAEKLAGGSIQGQKLRKIRFREALRVITDKNLMLTRAEIKKRWETAITEMRAQGNGSHEPSVVFEKHFFDVLGR